MKHPPDSLSADARALLRAARGGDDVPVAEHQRLLEAFRHRANTRERSSWVRGPRKHVAWALAALVSTGSLAALARPGTFERLEAVAKTVVERVLGTPAREHSAVRAASAPHAAPPSPAPAAPALPAAPEPAPSEMAPATPPLGATTELRDASAARASHPAPAAHSAARPTSSVRPLSSARSASTPLSAPTAGASASIQKHAAAPDDAAAEELDLIVAARNALAGRRLAEARAAAQRHALRFEHGAFSEEREAILALCDCRGGKALERARAFLERRPDSLFAERIRQDCALGSNLVPARVPAATHGESPR